MNKIIKFTIVLFTFVFIAPVFFSLQDVSARRHKTVPEKKRHELVEGGPYKGIFETRDLKVEYEYTREPGRLVMTGVVKFNREQFIKNFDLKANLIDADGKIVHFKRIAAAPRRTKIGKLPFESEMEMPAETWGVAFSYSGSTSDLGTGSGEKSSLWQTPF